MIDDQGGAHELIRELGAFEQLANGYNRTEPFQHCLVVHFDRELSIDQLQSSLNMVCCAHPLIAARVDRTAPYGVPAFRRDTSPLTVSDTAKGQRWEDVAARQQVDRMDDAQGPLIRAIRVARGDTCSVVLTFPHQVVDGIGAVQVVRDLLRSLNGIPVPVEAIPDTQERALLDRLGERGTEVDPDGGTLIRRERGPVRSRRRADGRPPHVHALVLTVDQTRTVTETARAHGATVTGALAAAVTSSLQSSLKAPHSGPVRLVIPIDLRRSAGLSDAVANRILAPQLVIDGDNGEGLWTTARAVSDQLRWLRSPRSLREPVTELTAGTPYSSKAALDAFTMFLSADVELSNLGVVDLPNGPSAAVTGLDGPILDTRIEGQHTVGAITINNQLRLVLVTYAADPALLNRVAQTLTTICD